MKETHKMGNKKPKDMRDGGEARSKSAPTDESHFAGECAYCGKSSGSARGRDAGRCEEDAKAHETAGGTRNSDARLVAPVASEAPEEPSSSSSPTAPQCSVFVG